MEPLQLEIAPWKNDAEAALTFSFDDGFLETMKNCLPYLNAKGIGASWNIITGHVGTSFEGQPTIGWTDVERLSDEPGMEIASHSVAHLASGVSPFGYLRHFAINYYHATNRSIYLRQAMGTLRSLLHYQRPIAETSAPSKADFYREAADSMRDIEKHIGNSKVKSYVYPHGRLNRHYRRCVKAATYTSARGTLSGYNTYSNTDFYELKSMVWERHASPENADHWVDVAVKKKAWLIQTLHLLSNTVKNYRLTTPFGHFQRHVERTLSRYGGVLWIDTQGEIANYMHRRMFATTKVISSSSSQVIIELSGADYHPGSAGVLTLKVNVPAAWHDAVITQGDSVCQSRRENNQVIFNAIPGEGLIRLMYERSTHD